MKLGLKRNIYNAEIRNRRIALGLSQSQLAEKIGVSNGLISCAEVFRKIKHDSPVIRKLAQFFNVEPDVLLPEWMEIINEMPTKQDVHAEFTEPMIKHLIYQRFGYNGEKQSDEMLKIDKIQLKEEIQKGLTTISPKQAQAIELRFGLNEKPHTYSEIGKVLKVTRESARQIVLFALKKLRIPMLSSISTD